ncbi:MAG: hypothetical protein ACRD3T_04045 [Terriglobia bacterium]
MAHSTPYRERTFSPRASESGTAAAQPGLWKKVKLVATRAVFWPYERGSWQYDIICAVILAFIFLTPAAWFHDRPQLGLSDLRHNQGVVEVGRTREGWHYLIDARLVNSMGNLKTKDAVHAILERRIHKPFTIKSVEVVEDHQNVLLGYAVIVQR